MYYKLFLYYHVLGHNPKFYPKLFEMLRQDPMSGGYNQNGSTSILHFYKKCCEAAGEDLTEFFRAYGFFRVMTNRLVGDYANSVYDQTQKDIDDAIAEVKALAETKGWEQNIAVLFINDDTGEQILSHRDDVEYLQPYESADSELGCYASYVNTIEPNYTYTITGNTVTMTGKGGTGIAIFNKNGELIGFSDNKTFKVSDECAVAIASGQAKVVAMKADNTPVEAVDIMDTDDNEAKHALLGELLDNAKAIVDFSDESNSKLGYYREDALTDLQTVYDNAKKVYDDRAVASYDAVYDALNVAYSEILHNDYARIGLVVGNAYRLQNKNYPERFMSVEWKKWKTEGEGENAVDVNNWIMVGETTELTDAQKWYFEESDTEGRYYIKNKSTGKYVANAIGSTAVTVDKTKEEAQTYKLEAMGNGLWALVGSDQNLHHGAWNYSYNVLGWWDNNATASQWYITAVELDDAAEKLYDLKTLIGETEALIDEVGYATQVQLQATDSLAAFHLYCNALYNRNAGNNNEDNSMNTAKLLDGDFTTHIHTDYRGGSTYEAHDDLDHYLRVDLGSGNAVSEFKFTYTTRNAGDANAHPKTIKIEGSNNLVTFEEIATLPRTGETPLPGANTNNDGRGKYTSPTITNGKEYRYLRFMVTETQGTGKSYGNHPYFYMAEFDLELDNIVKVDGKYSSEITVDELANAFNSLLSAKEIVENANSEQYATAYTALEEYYNALLADKNTIENSNLTSLKNELFTLMGNTTTLIGECGTVTFTPGTFNGKAPLQTTEVNGAFYLWTNAQSTQEGPIADLIDGNNNSYFHSDYSGNNSKDELDHHITVNLGEGNKAQEFTFKYVTRHNADTNYPKTIKVLGSVDGDTYEEITSVTDLPVGNTETYLSDTITATKYYSYLRFMVTENNNTDSSKGVKGGHHIFHMAEFELNIIGIPESYTVELGAGAGDAGTDLLIETYKKNAEAQGAYDYATSEMQVEAAIAKLQAQYDKLLAAQQSSDKAALRELVALATTLINECGTLTYVESPSTASVELKATETTGYAYLSCPYLFYDMRDNPGDSDTNCADLLDNNTSTYIHTNYNAAQSTYPHYLQVAFGANEIPLQFKFSYTTRHNGPNQVPKHIIVKGSNDGVNFKDVGEYDWEDGNSPLPTTQNTSWTAPEYLTGGYAYLRFYVTKSPASVEGATNTTTPFFAMSEFSMSYTGYAIKWNNAQHGTATNEHLIAAYEARNAANELLATTTTKDDLQAATTALQEKYTELYNAKNGIQNINFTISSNVLGGGVNYNEVDYTETLIAPSILTASELKAIALEDYVAKSITVADGVITIIYNKVYTVTITGGEGEGRVTFGDDEYANDGTFDASQNSFTAADVEAKNVEGYTKSEVTVNHETGAISVTYTLDKSALNTLLGETLELIYACDGFVNSAFVTTELLNEANAAWGTAQEALGTVQTRSELSDALNDLQAAHDKLNAAKTSAEAEAAERTALKSQLSTLITETETLIASCYDNDVLKYVNSEFVTEETISAVRTLVEAAEAKCETPGTTADEYRASISALTEAKSTLTTAIENAKAEATERNELKSQLLSFVGETETLIASCYENEVLKFINSEFVTEETISAVRTLIEAAEAKCETPGTTASEYNASITELTTAKEELATAITNAIAEAEERNAERALLNELINATKELITLCGTTPGDATQALIDEVSAAVTLAQAIADNVENTQDELTEAKEALQAKYDVLSAAQQSTAKADLLDLISQTEDLINLCGDIELSPATESEGVVTLQTEDPNAPFYLSTNATENNEGVIGNLLKDGDDYFHSAWSYAVGEAHYLQVDMGEGYALKEFVFSYTTKNNLRSPYPTEIVVSGSNDGVSFKQLDVFNEGLPTTASTSCDIRVSLNRSYRYLRFVVTKSAAEGVNCKPRDEFYCFAISKFSITEYPANETYYVASQNPNGSVTEEQLLNVFDAKNEATEFAANSYNQSELNSKKNELQALYNALLLANNTNLLPIVFTTNMENPVLYTLKSKRGDTKTLQYDPAADHMFSIAEKSDANVKQMFYFTIGDERTKVYVHPFAAGEQVLAASNTGDGAAKVFAKEKGELRYEQWTIVEVKVNEVVWYNLRPAGTSTNFSNYGGVNSKMGFYGTSNDDGSLFQFIEVDESTIEGSSAYHSLKVYYDEVTKVKSAEITGSSNVGYYPENEAIAYNLAYANAAELLNGTSDYDNYLATYKALLSANEALVMNMPEEGVYYTIVSACSGTRGGQLMYATGENKIKFGNDKKASDDSWIRPEALWTITAEGYLKNLQTGCSVCTSSTWGGHHTLAEEGAKAVSIESLSLDGQIKLTPQGGHPLHAQETGSVVVGWPSGANDASAWRIVEVKDMAQVKHPVSITQYEHAGLYLNYPVTIPDDVKAYYLDGSKISIDDNGIGTLKLTLIDGNILPARTAVILYAPHGDYDFVYTEEQTDEYENLFTGSTYQTYREAEENHRYYVFGQNYGEVGLYKNGVKYDATGAEGTTHYKMSANKILFDWNNRETGQQANSFRFLIGEQTTTDIDDELMDADVVIYDLYGRRILEVTTSGIYLINGEKHYIRVK
ncbi:MAG: discoidin domain-containing protein [Bacteroidaceae bacterium]|nr:discoidin domain-containing protein [Bacteroidaceae bacterium]